MISAALLALATTAVAATSSSGVEPYLDRLREKISEKSDPPPGSYIEQVRKELEEENRLNRGDPSDPEPYIRRLRQKAEENAGTPPPSYIDGIRAREPHEDDRHVESGKTLQSYQDGKHPEARKRGSIHHAVGLRYGASLIRDITVASGAAAASYTSVYGASYTPDLSLFYEFQPFHSEWFGNIGFVGMAGVSVTSAVGQFPFALAKAGGGNFPTESRTTFRFISVPVTAGVNYRFNLLRILRPFAFAGATIVGYREQRDDGGNNYQGFSTGYQFSVGVSLLLDWISRGAEWDMYRDWGVHHYYLTAEYNRLQTVQGDVNFLVSGIQAGLTFEF